MHRTFQGEEYFRECAVLWKARNIFGNALYFGRPSIFSIMRCPFEGEEYLGLGPVRRRSRFSVDNALYLR
jgi:hypothetical protein